jgi:hypothetical protein
MRFACEGNNESVSFSQTDRRSQTESRKVDATVTPDGTAIVIAILGLTQSDENFHISWNHSAKLWRFNSSWLDIELTDRSLRPLLESAVDAIKRAKEQVKERL